MKGTAAEGSRKERGDVEAFAAGGMTADRVVDALTCVFLPAVADVRSFAAEEWQAAACRGK